MELYLLLVLVIVSSHVHADGDAAVLSRTNRQASAYIIRLVPTCPPSTDPGSVGKLELQADVPSEAQAFCKNGNLTFSSVNKPIYELAIVLSSPTGTQCEFFKKVNVSVYTAHVVYGWGDPGSPILTSNKQELVTCSYDGYGNIQSGVHQILDYPLAPGERAYYLGNRTALPVTLSVVNILDQIIDGSDIIVGRTIRLMATVNQSANFSQSVKAVTCFAQNSAGVNHAVLRGGCGDGIIFSKYSGFTTSGIHVYSPYFKTFKLKGASDLKFNCTFIVCSGNCEGSSCTVLRRKRDMAAASTGVLVHNPGPPMVDAIAMILVHEHLTFITISTASTGAGKGTKRKPPPVKSQIKVISFRKININKKNDMKVSKSKSKKAASNVNNKDDNPQSAPSSQEQKEIAVDTGVFVVLPEEISKEDPSKLDEMIEEQTDVDEFQYVSSSIYVGEPKVALSMSEGRVVGEDLSDILRISSQIITLDANREGEMLPIGVEDDFEMVELGTGNVRIIQAQPGNEKVDMNNKLLLIKEPEIVDSAVPTAFSINSFTFFVAMTICSLIIVILIASGMYLCRRSRAIKANNLDIAIITTAQDINKITKDFEDVKIDKADIVCDAKPDVTSNATMAPPPQASDTYIMGGSAHCS